MKKAIILLGLSLNLVNYKPMAFNRIRSPLLFSYHLHNSIIPRCDRFVMDLVFKLSNILDPGLQIEMVCCESLRMLGIIMMLSLDLKLSSSFKVHEIVWMQYSMGYGVILWDAHTADNACQVERVQRRFQRFTGYFLGIFS